ncbi:MAG: acyltransferase [Terriglobales bacterium]|jgi:peptidoglycan/LPS O-acetylase OafA/YrhL
MKRIPSLDGLRAISVSLVLVGHLARAGHTPQPLSVYASSGVRMFFVISGYLITTILTREHTRTSTINLREFYIRRAYRILPAAVVFMLFASVAYWRELRWIDIGAMFLYLLNYDGGRPWMVGHLWSLCVEEQFYFLWPGALTKWYRHRVGILLAVVAIAPIYSALCFHFKVFEGGYGTFPAVADNLAIGCLLAISGSKLPKINSWAALAMLLAVILIPYYPAITPLRTLFELFVLWPIMNCSMAGLLLHVVQTPYRFLNIAPVVWLGKISYSLYLWQQPFFFAPPGQPTYRLLFGVGLACLSYYLVERPILELREKRNVVRPSKAATLETV